MPRRCPESMCAGVVATLLCLAVSVAGAAPTLRFGGGAGYERPAAVEIREIYGSGPAFFIEQETVFRPNGIALGLELGYRRSSAHLSAPFFVSDAEATLLSVPFSAVLRIPVRRSGAIRPYLGLGLRMLWSRESFEYTISGDRLDRVPEGTMDPGWILVGGIEHAGGPHPRLEISYSHVPTRRMVAASNAIYDTARRERIDAGSLSARISMRFP